MVTVHCGTGAGQTQFRAMALCQNGDWHFGPWVLQGPGHASVARCDGALGPIVFWDRDLQ